MLRQFFSNDRSRYTELVELAYRSVLHRPADADGLANYAAQLASGQLDAEGLLRSLMLSEEYTALSRRLSGEALFHGVAPRLSLSEPVRKLSAALAASSVITWADYIAAWQSVFSNPAYPLVIGQDEYGVTHQRRFFETINALAILGAGRSGARLLEFGASDFSVLYRRFFSASTLAIADRPVPEDYIGFTENVARNKLGASEFYAIDLQAAQQFDSLLGNMPRFSHILFCEVLEHLVVNPVEIIKFLISLLNDDGILYLTTPNFFRKQNLEKISQRINPQEIYPQGSGNWDAHFHHREFDIRELTAFAKAAQAEVKACYFSDCWDTGQGNQYDDESLGNIVMVLGRDTN